ncbi:MAG: P-loop NTPase [Clostridiales bacterium]|nr:P-loop NTPase [Clostridiales bacterium]
MKKITVITGHYGVGKTNISVNLAVKLADEGKRVTVVDLDIVNPYFRTADFSELFKDRKIELIKPMYANSNLDIPAISFDLERIVSENKYIIIDVGGDDAGAIALGRYAEALSRYQSDLDMYYVINCYRYLTRTSEEALELMKEIETASRMKHTGIINNSNLGNETTAEDIKASRVFADEIAEKSNLPIIFHSFNEKIGIESMDGFLGVEVFVKPLWEQ